MNPSNTHHKSNFITLYCDRSTQTMDQDDSSETKELDFCYFPPCQIGKHPPLLSLNGSPLPISTQSQYHMASPSGIQQFSTTSDDKEPPQSQHHRQPITGLGLVKTWAFFKVLKLHNSRPFKFQWTSFEEASYSP